MHGGYKYTLFTYELFLGIMMWSQLWWLHFFLSCCFHASVFLSRPLVVVGLCCYLMQWAVSRVSGVSLKVSETVSSCWRWTLPSIPTPPASTSRPAWSCATGHLISERVRASWCPLYLAKKHGPSAGFKPVTTWSSTTSMATKGCEYLQPSCG